MFRYTDDNEETAYAIESVRVVPQGVDTIAVSRRTHRVTLRIAYSRNV